jgi:hypothetical protein
MEITQENNALVQIIETSGLEKTKAQVLLEKFTSYFEIAADWEKKIKMLEITDVSQKAEMKMAREGRLFLKEKRVQIDKTHKELKEASLREGQTLDSIKRILTNLIKPLEEELEQKEKFAEIKEAQRKESLRLERLEKLRVFDFQYDNGFNLGEMDEPMFQNLLSGCEKAYNEQKEAEKKLEEERIAKEKAEVEERERIKKENEKLKKEAEEKEKVEAARKSLRSKRSGELRPYIIFIRDYSSLIEKEEKEYQKELAEIKKGAELQWDHDRKEMARKAQEQSEQEAKLQKERAERERVEAELRAKKEAEEKAMLEAEAKAEEELNKGDKEKLQSFMQDLEMLKFKYTFKSKKYRAINKSVGELLDKTINYALSKK